MASVSAPSEPPAQAASPAVALLGQMVESLARIEVLLKAQTRQGEAVRRRADEAAERLPAGSVEAFLVCWNTNRGRLPEAKSARSPLRRRRILEALKVEADLGRWEQAIRALAASEWHTRGLADGGWVADIDWLLRSQNFETWLERGDERHRAAGAAAPTTRTQVWCSTPDCEQQGLFGPGTRNEDLAETTLCADCFEQTQGMGE